MSVLLHRHVQDRNVSRLGAWAFSVAGKAIATNAQIVLSDEEMKRRRAVGSFCMKSAAMSTKFRITTAADVPIKAGNSLVSKWLGQIGRSQALLAC